MEWYPQLLQVDPLGTQSTIDFMKTQYEQSATFHYAEFGIYEGSTAFAIASYFPNCHLYLFDYQTTIGRYIKRFESFGNRVQFFGNSDRYLDSYNWSLANLIAANPKIKFDYVFLDGAHTLAVDGLTFFIAKFVLNEGGYIDFGDYNWRVTGSSLDPSKVPQMSYQYTQEQMDDYQVKRIINLFVTPDSDFSEVVENKVYQFRKPSSKSGINSVHSTMAEEEIKFLTSNLEKAEKYLEFGAGYSTLLALHCSTLEIVSVETDSNYIEFLRNEFRTLEYLSDKIEICHVDIGPTGEWGVPLELGQNSKVSNYLIAPWAFVTERGFNPDLILIDGRYRVATFLNAFINCPGAYVIFDDYIDRPQYKVVESILLPSKYVGRIACFKIPKYPSRKTLLRAYKLMLDNYQNYL